MMTHIVFPNYDPSNAGSAYAFLNGPIRNAPPWHEDMIDLLTQKAEAAGVYLRICCPKREDDLVRRLPELCRITHRISWEMRPPFPRQRPWEWANQEPAARSGGMLFWLPAPGKIVYPDKVYGAITQFELGTWLEKAAQDPRLRIAIGSDGVYNGELRTLLYDIERQAPHLLPLHNSMESLCDQSIAWAKEGEF